MKEINFTISFNNEGLRRMFPGTKISRKGNVTLGELSPSFLLKSIRKINVSDFSKFELIELELQGSKNNFDLIIKMNVW